MLEARRGAEVMIAFDPCGPCARTVVPYVDVGTIRLSVVLTAHTHLHYNFYFCFISIDTAVALYNVVSVAMLSN